jgi:hypothetical protein
VWGGVHWRTSVTAGRELGRKVGIAALARARTIDRRRGHCMNQRTWLARSHERSTDGDCRVE